MNKNGILWEEIKLTYLLLRRRKGEDCWSTTTSGKAKYITEVLKLNLNDFNDFEWKVTPVDNS